MLRAHILCVTNINYDTYKYIPNQFGRSTTRNKYIQTTNFTLVIVKMCCCYCVYNSLFFLVLFVFFSISSIIRYLLTIFSHEKSLMPLHQTVSGSYRRQFACALYSTLASMLNYKHLIYSEMHFILHVFKIKWDWVRFVCRDFLLCCFFFSLVFTRWLEIYVCIDMSTRFVY